MVYSTLKYYNKTLDGIIQKSIMFLFGKITVSSCQTEMRFPPAQCNRVISSVIFVSSSLDISRQWVLLYYSFQLLLSSSSNLTRSFKSTSSSLAVFISISNGGCDELVHHFDTVVGAHPSCLDSQRLDLFFSTSTTFKRLRSLLAAILHILD